MTDRVRKTNKTIIQPLSGVIHAMYFYDTEDSRYDLETVLAAKHMRMLLSDLKNEIRSKIKHQEQDHWQEFRDCLYALLEEYDLHKLD